MCSVGPSLLVIGRLGALGILGRLWRIGIRVRRVFVCPCFGSCEVDLVVYGRGMDFARYAMKKFDGIKKRKNHHWYFDADVNNFGRVDGNDDRLGRNGYGLNLLVVVSVDGVVVCAISSFSSYVLD